MRMINARRSIFILCMSLVALTGTSPIIAQAIDQIVLIVDDYAVTAREFRVLQLIHNPVQSNDTISPDLDDKVTTDIIDELLLSVHARRIAQDVQITDKQVEVAIQALAAQNKLNAAQLIAQLNRQSVDLGIFADSIRQRLLVKQVLGDRIARSVNVSPSEIQEYINSRPELRAQMQKSYLLSHLSVTIEEGMSDLEIENLRQIAQDVRQQLQDGATFSDVIANSERVQSSNALGDLGWKKQAELPDLFLNTLSSLQVGDISPLITTDNGFHILALNDVKSGIASNKQYKIRHILKTIPPQGDISAIAAGLTNLKQQILAGIDFAALAQSESQDSSSNTKGGDLGWINSGQLDKSFTKAIEGLEVGQISDVFRTQYGLHLIQIQQVRELPVSATIEARIQQRIFAEKVNEKMDDLLNDLKQVAVIEVVSQ